MRSKGSSPNTRRLNTALEEGKNAAAHRGQEIAALEQQLRENTAAAAQAENARKQAEAEIETHRKELESLGASTSDVTRQREEASQKLSDNRMQKLRTEKDLSLHEAALETLKGRSGEAEARVRELQANVAAAKERIAANELRANEIKRASEENKQKITAAEETIRKANAERMEKEAAVTRLTQGTFKVTGVHPADGITDEQLVEAAALAESWSKHPISLSIKAAYGKEIDTSRVTDVEELGGHGVTAKVDGKPVAAGNARLMERLGLSAPAVSETGTVVHIAIDGRYAGCLLIADVVKPHSAEAIRALKTAGVRKTVMLTGDAEPVAKAVSAQLGLDEYHAGLLPGDKVDQIETLLAAKKSKENLAFVGDGINDAPVLSRADVGIAMGALGSDAAIEAADVVLMDDDPAKIALAMRIARRTLRIVYENIVFALAVKFACLLLGAIGMASMWTAIFADVGVMVIAVLNATRALYTKDLVRKSQP